MLARLCLAALALSLFLVSVTTASAADPDGMAFFESKIRPVLVNQCYECHSAQSKSPKGGLLVDSRDALLAGGDSGPAIVPGKVEESPLIEAIRHDGLEMPPTRKLPPEVIADFEKWVHIGAPDPRVGKALARGTMNIEEGRKFWSFQPLRHTSAPEVKDRAWPMGDIDRHILAALDARDLHPVAEAEPRMLVRRLYFDLVGLPPTAEEVHAFATATGPAYEKLVDKLLASPHFGERWGRHWLDLARYADSNGKDENFTFHNAWRYRNYVINAFNRDKPFNQFVMEQIAGDLMYAISPEQRDERLIATSFLVLGPKVLADRNKLKRKLDVIDEQIDTVGKVFLGLTLGCARCHDHKFDPVPTADYYALAGIFSSTSTLNGIKGGNAVIAGWIERPLGPDGEAKAQLIAEHQVKLKSVSDRLRKAQAALKSNEDKAWMKQPAFIGGIVVDDEQATFVGKWKPSVFNPHYVGKGYVHDDKQGKGEKSAKFTPDIPRAAEYEVLLAYTGGKGRETKTPVTIKHAGGETTITVNQEATPPIDDLYLSLGKFRFEAGKQGSVTISNQGTAGYVIVDAVRFVPVGAVVDGAKEGVAAEVQKALADAKKQVAELQAEEKALKANPPPAVPMAMAAKDESQPGNCTIYIRGDSDNPGREVPRGFLTAATATTPPKIPNDQSGRLQLAEWLVQPTNPLVARVMVNRIWQHLLGNGLVRTVDNFGHQGEVPSHPELLDMLAARFIDDGWSVKQVVRQIVLSRTYRLSVANDAKAAKADPENRLLWRGTRRRLEVEAIRDAMLFTSGRLDLSQPEGSPVASLGERAIGNNNEKMARIDVDQLTCRSTYLPVIRNELPQMFQVFDFANADVATGRRDVTTVPPQALYLLNSPFAFEQARQTAQWLMAAEGTDDASRVKLLYRRALARDPNEEEVKTTLQFLAAFEKATATENKNTKQDKKTNESPAERAWAAVCQAMFGCTEFRYIE
jgi:hypothetical protein